MMPSEYIGLSCLPIYAKQYILYIYACNMGQMYASMDHPMVYYAYNLPRLMPSEYMGLSWNTYGSPIQWCTARIALSQSTYSTIVYVAYPWVTHAMVYGAHSPLPEYL